MRQISTNPDLDLRNLTGDGLKEGVEVKGRGGGRWTAYGSMPPALEEEKSGTTKHQTP